MENEMKPITLKVGDTYATEPPTDLRRPVAFTGERLARVRLPKEWEGDGKVCEWRTLYRLDDGRFLIFFESIHIAETCSWIRIVSPADLDVGGRYELLGHAAGITRPRTVDEALELQ